MSILRKKNHKVAHSNFGPSRLSNDIQSLIDDFHKDSDTFVHVGRFVACNKIVGCSSKDSRKTTCQAKSLAEYT